jgi:hypothetical protein
MENLILVQRKKEEAKNKLEEISKEKDSTKLIDLYKELLKINNTDEDIVFKYLLFVKEIYKNSKISIYGIDEFKKYINHIQIKKWNDNFSNIVKKKYSSLEKLNLIFQKILSQNWAHTDYKNMKLVLQYFANCIDETSKEIDNTSPITWENGELYIYYLYRDFIGKIKEKILYYSEENFFNNIKNKEFIKCNEKIESLQTKLADETSEPLKKELLKLIEKEKKIRESLVLCEGDFFKEYLYNFHDYLFTIKKTFLEDFSNKKFDNKTDKEFFENFMLYIAHYNFENLTEEMLNVWENSFRNLAFSEKVGIVTNYCNQYSPFHIKFENETTIEITQKQFKKTIVINNIDDYDLKNVLKEIKKQGKFDENEFIKFVKIPKIKEHLYITKIMKEWIQFNITIFNSNTIKSLYSKLFDNQDNSLLNENELRTVFENIVYYNFETDFKGLTIRPIMKIYEYGPLIPLENKELSKLISLSFLLNLNEHEILGHYNIGYQIFIHHENKKDYDSPKVDNELSSDYSKARDDRESGEDIELKLYGRVIDYLTLNEALFILNPKNYEVDYKQFNQNFKECNNAKEKININQEFSNILQKFNINVKEIPKDKNNKFSTAKFIKKFTDQNSFTIKGKHPQGFNIDGVKNEGLGRIKQIMHNFDYLDDYNYSEK